MQQTLIALARTGATEGEMRRQVREKFATVSDSERIILLLKDPWHRWFIHYDPAPMLEKVKCPVLVLNGDLQVVADRPISMTTKTQRVRKAAVIPTQKWQATMTLAWSMRFKPVTP